ncbi:hypothetical protein BC834DRAFT_866203 [Gloeopeniophorella convolvens]|nr:hypothetical protein BC834DRAFT_866203 [Gloeopeniophorella convolvens]
MGLTEDVVLSPREIDALLEATPITLDLSLTHYHPPAPASSTNTDTTDAILPADAAATAPPTAPEAESKQLWWHHPAFEARAKADIRRTLRLLLPPSDPDLASAPARAEVRRRQSSARMWATRLEDAFGPGPLDRGTGRKPRRLAGPKHAAGAREGRARWGGGAVVMPPRRAWPALAPPSRQPTPDHGDAGEVAAAALPPAEMNVDIDLDAVVPSADGTQHTAVPDAGAAPAPAPAAEPEGYVTLTEAAAWTAALLPLAKGKALPDAAMLARAHDALSAADHARRISTRVLKESGLADAVKRVGEEKGGPLRNRARQLAEWWRANFGDAALGLAEP